MPRRRAIVFPMTSNPYHDADRYEEMCENVAHLECTHCGKYLFNGDTCYRIDGDVYCPECTDDEFRETVDLNDYGAN